jgi:hypothetical protein
VLRTHAASSSSRGDDDDDGDATSSVTRSLWHKYML